MHEKVHTYKNVYTHKKVYIRIRMYIRIYILNTNRERWGAGVETQKNVQEDFGGWGRVPFNETYAPSLSTIYDGA